MQHSEIVHKKPRILTFELESTSRIRFTSGPRLAPWVDLQWTQPEAVGWLAGQQAKFRKRLGDERAQFSYRVSTCVQYNILLLLQQQLIITNH